MFNLPFLSRRVKDVRGNGFFIHGERVRMIVGLGNPGKKYENTYHNAGYLFLDALCKYLDAPGWKSASRFEFVSLGNLVLVKPTVFMNNSGSAAAAALRRFGVRPDEMLVVHDESDIELGNYKLAKNRGPAGHNGIASVIQALKTAEFGRIRIGVRTKRGKAGSFVLKNMNAEDWRALESLFQKLLAEHFEAYRK